MQLLSILPIFFYFSSSTLRLSMYYVHIMSHYIHTYISGTYRHTYMYMYISVQKNSSQYKEAIRTKMHFNRKSISCPLGQLCTDNADCPNSIYICILYYTYISIQVCYVCLDTNVPPCFIRVMCNDNARLGEELMKNFRRILSQVTRIFIA